MQIRHVLRIAQVKMLRRDGRGGPRFPGVDEGARAKAYRLCRALQQPIDLLADHPVFVEHEVATEVLSFECLPEP